MSGVIYSYLGPYVRLEAEKGNSVLNLSSFVSELGWMFGALPATTIRLIPPQYFSMVGFCLRRQAISTENFIRMFVRSFILLARWAPFLTVSNF